MSKWLVVGDIHLADLAPSSCTESYTDDLFTILEHTVRLESELKLDGVIWSGDVFHVRQANRNSHRLVQRAIDLVQSYKKLFIVVGNHDQARGDRAESIFETQPLGILLKAGAKLLDGWAKDGSPIYGVPWLQEWTQEAVEGAFGAWTTKSPQERSQSLVVAHAPLFPESLEPPWEYYPTGESRHGDDSRKSWSEIQGSGFTYYGHVHDCHGTYQVGNVTFCNQGAITRGSLHESDLNRSIAVTTWAQPRALRSADEGFIRIDVPHKPSSEVFKIMEKREKEDKKADLSEFLESVGSAQVEITNIESIVAHLKAMDLPDNIVKLAVELLESAK